MSLSPSLNTPPTDLRSDAVIIGAGISGLVAAYHLRRAGLKVLVLESSHRTGGVIETLRTDGYLIERGPNSLRGTREFLDLIDDLGIRSELVTGDPKLPAYTYSRNELRAVPMTLSTALRTDCISTRAKLRLLREPFIPRHKPAIDESIASFFRRRLGREILDELVTPFISGIYAGDPEKLSIGSCFPSLVKLERESGSLAAGVLSRLLRQKPRRQAMESLRPYRLCSFRDGLSTLTKALEKRLEGAIVHRARVEQLAREKSEVDGYVLRISSTSPAGNREVWAKSVIVATPASAAASILATLSPSLSRLLEQITYNSLASVPLGCIAHGVPEPNGFGFLATKSAGLRTLGSIWNSSAFVGRAKEGSFLTTSFVGGTTDPHAIDLPDETLREAVKGDLEKVLGNTLEIEALPLTKYERAIPQYELGHSALVAEIDAKLATIPRLELTGNYLRGVSLGDCIRSAITTAEKVEMGLRSVHTLK